MALKDRFRRAINRSSTTTRSNSSTSSSHITPPSSASTSPTDTTPSITLTKTSSRLSKRLTWRSDAKLEKAAKQRQERADTWEDWDRRTPIPEKKKGPHQDILRAFEWKWRSSMDGGAGNARRSLSIWSGSGVSPGCSRAGSMDEGAFPRRIGSVGRKSLGRRSSRDSAHNAGVRPTGEMPVEPVPEE